MKAETSYDAKGFSKCSNGSIPNGKFAGEFQKTCKDQTSDTEENVKSERKYIDGHIETKDNKEDIQKDFNKTKSLRCIECGYTFKYKSLLQKHVKEVHQRIKDFQCDYCNYAASRLSHLNTHLNLVHSSRKKVSNEIKNLKCEECQFRCACKGSLNRHIRAVHSGVNFKCDTCTYSSSRKDLLKRHKREIYS